jgi:hypothetical protein
MLGFFALGFWAWAAANLLAVTSAVASVVLPDFKATRLGSLWSWAMAFDVKQEQAATHAASARTEKNLVDFMLNTPKRFNRKCTSQ